MSRRFIPCTLAAGSTALVAGDIVTGGYVVRNGSQIAAATVRDVVMQNGLVRVTYEQKTPDGEKGALTLYRWDGDSYERAVSEQYGDWTYFAVGFPSVADRITVVESSPEMCEMVLEWDAHNMSAFNSGGPYSLGHDDDVVYTSGAVLKKIATTNLHKVARLVRGREGYFMGYHTIPRVGPQFHPLNAHETGAGEREFGTGGLSRVFFTSANVQCLHPDWGDRAGWAAAGFTGSDNRPCWGGIDDPPVAPWTTTAASLMPSGFPNEQTTGPWWAADLSYDNSSRRFCRYLALVTRFELGSWQFGSGQYGATVCHFTNEAQDSAGLAYRFQVFLGAFPYTSADLSLEPTTALKQRVAARIPLDFDETGNADDNGVEYMTAASVRDELIAAVEAISA